MTLRSPASLAASAAALALSACAGVTSEPFSPAPRQTAVFQDIGYATWSYDEPSYRIYAGDQIEVRVPSAPELNKAVTVQPDGRVSLPLIEPVMAADLGLLELRDVLTRAYSAQLVRPDVEVSLVQAQPLKVFIGGEVDKPGVYDMPGPIDALQGVIQAGGFKPGARRSQVILIRRGADGRAMMRTLNLSRGIFDPANTEVGPLRRFDIVYVPRTGAVEAGLFMQQYVRDLLPIQFSYAINGFTR